MLKKVISIILTLFIGISMTACNNSKSTESNKDASDDEFTVAYLYTAMYPFMISVKNSMEATANELGIKLICQDIEDFDVSLENNLIENFIVQEVDMIIAFFADPEGNAPAAQAAYDAGIPVITLCNKVNGGDAIYVGSDDVYAGYSQAEWLNKNYPEGGKILYLTTTETSNTYENRNKGLVENLNDNFQIVSQQNCDGRRDYAIDVMDTWLQAYSDEDFNIIVTHSDQSALGAVEALKAANRMRDDLAIVSVDGDQDALDSIKAGEITVTAYQNAIGIGDQAIRYADEISKGAKPETLEDVYVDWIMTDKNNVDEVYNKAYGK